MTTKHSEKLGTGWVKITDLVPAEYNPRQMTRDDYDKLKNEIEAFGLVELFVVNSDGTLISGHQRRKAIIELEDDGRLYALPSIADLEAKADAATERANFLARDENGDLCVYCNRVNLKKHQEKALNLALNKISGDWQFDKLTDILNELSQIEEDDFEISLTGFDENDVSDLLAGDESIDLAHLTGGPTLIDAYNEDHDRFKNKSPFEPANVILFSIGGFIQSVKENDFSDPEQYKRLSGIVKTIEIADPGEKKQFAIDLALHILQNS